MSDVLISLSIFAAFAGVWALLLKIGTLDWLFDSRMETARRMLASAKFAFDGEMHGVASAASDTRVTKVTNVSGWGPAAHAHA